jgi:peroxiredoxin
LKPDTVFLWRQPVSRKGWLGIAMKPAPEGGVLVEHVVPGSPAAGAGLEVGDRVTTFAGDPVTNPVGLQKAVLARIVGERVSVGVVRSGETRMLAVELAGRPVDSDIQRMNFVGEPAPEFGSLKTVQGSAATTLGAMRGKVVVIEFWASWCQVCSFLVPTMNDWQDRFGPQGALVMGVTVDSVNVALDAAQRLDMRYPLASDEKGTATRAYQARAIPTVFVIDQRGTVREVVVGFSEERLKEVEALITELLAGS